MENKHIDSDLTERYLELNKKSLHKESYPFREKICGDKKVTIIEPAPKEDTTISLEQYETMVELYTDFCDKTKSLVQAIYTGLPEGMRNQIYRDAGLNEDFINEILRQ